MLLSLWSSGVERGSSCRIDAATALQLKFQVVKGKKEREEGESKVFFWGKQMLLVVEKNIFLNLVPICSWNLAVEGSRARTPETRTQELQGFF